MDYVSTKIDIKKYQNQLYQSQKARMVPNKSKLGNQIETCNIHTTTTNNSSIIHNLQKEKQQSSLLQSTSKSLKLKTPVEEGLAQD